MKKIIKSIFVLYLTFIPITFVNSCSNTSFVYDPPVYEKSPNFEKIFLKKVQELYEDGNFKNMEDLI
ncbi:hypothetical protein [Spiroplasma taiwanense]|uniref:Lipoprotein n=1 Tax=Spiroplasma taiwanense CT-1 TaxID=1276220 RepID=S5MC13_9MOLU|nr:hypothetical protein [Spiroplasma taiwanense]AGR41273.1 hypothetical protein STAIW_v1c06550 [Spiroplasma taiwanense CT-1]